MFIFWIENKALETKNAGHVENLKVSYSVKLQFVGHMKERRQRGIFSESGCTQVMWEGKATLEN